MSTPRVCFTAAALAIFAAACAPSPASSPAPVASANAGTRPRAIPVQVTNQNFNTMNIYVMHDGGRWLVGQVDGLSDTTITIPAGLAPADYRLRLRAEAIAGGSTMTPTLLVSPGQRVYWTLGSDLSISTASAG
jgi:hypothetical protein